MGEGVYVESPLLEPIEPLLHKLAYTGMALLGSVGQPASRNQLIIIFFLENR